MGGWNFGMSSDCNSRTEWDLKDVTKNSVTFADGPKVCRVLGLKVEDVLGAPKTPLAQHLLNSPVPKDLIQDLNAGNLPYNDFIDKLHGR